MSGPVTIVDEGTVTRGFNDLNLDFFYLVCGCKLDWVVLKNSNMIFLLSCVAGEVVVTWWWLIVARAIAREEKK